MIRKAVLNDISNIEDTYNEHFEYETEHKAYTVFKKGVYPTRTDAENYCKEKYALYFHKSTAANFGHFPKAHRPVERNGMTITNGADNAQKILTLESCQC